MKRLSRSELTNLIHMKLVMAPKKSKFGALLRTRQDRHDFCSSIAELVADVVDNPSNCVVNAGDAIGPTRRLYPAQFGLDVQWPAELDLPPPPPPKNPPTSEEAPTS